MRIALTGNPNSGKTTMFNALTGRNEKVGNWAGVTVDKKESPIKKNFYDGSLILVDLPGAYSMSPFTNEESVTSDYVKSAHLDAIINIVDATNLSRSLFFTTQLLELGVPMVVALNKADMNQKKQTRIDGRLLSELLGCPVVETVSTSAVGLQTLVEAAVARVGHGQRAPYHQGRVDLADKDAVRQADKRRFAFVNEVVRQVEHRKVRTSAKNAQDRVDRVLTHPVWGLGIFALVMFLVFDLSQSTVGPAIADRLVALLEGFQGWVGELFSGAAPILQALLVDGVIGGVIAVIGFLPLVMVMYFLISLLEDCGYMARATVVLDPLFKKVGLSGKSVIPFVVGTGCAIPGIMACRTIRGERERRATAMLAPFMPCGAKLPVIGLFAGAFFENASWVGTLMYFAGILLILVGALLVKKITGAKKQAYFIMELPEYKAPSLIRAVKDMCSRGWAFIVKAMTVILLCNTIIQIMQSFTWELQVAETAGESILAAIAQPFAYLLVPVVGVLSWQLAAAAITGFIAKENVVGTLAVCFVGLDNLIDTEALELAAGAGAEVAGVMAITNAAALAYRMFNLFTPPCFAALGAMNAEIADRKWFWGGVALQMGTGFTVGFLVYQVGTLIATGGFGVGFVPGLMAVAVMAAIVARLCARGEQKALAGKR